MSNSSPLRDATDNTTSGGSAREDFLRRIEIKHGPADLLARFFLLAETLAHDRNVTLEWGRFEDLVEANRRNLASWGQLVRTFDCTKGPIPADEAFCIIGRDPNGEIVATQAARLYRIGGERLGGQMRSLRFFYPHGVPAEAGKERCEVWAPAADAIRGRVAYSGGGWYRKEFRRQSLSAILPRLSRAYALATWGTDYTFSMVARPLIEKGVVARYGYSKVEWGVRSSDNGVPYYEGAIVWMDTAELLADLRLFVAAGGPQIDGVVDQRRAHDQPPNPAQPHRQKHATIGRA